MKEYTGGTDTKKTEKGDLNQKKPFGQQPADHKPATGGDTTGRTTR